MSTNLQIFLIILLVIQFMLIVKTIKTKKLSIRYGSFWILLLIIMLFVVIFPNILFKISSMLGFEKTSNMLFLLGFFFLYYINFILTTSISKQNESIKSLAQEIAILKEKNNSERDE